MRTTPFLPEDLEREIFEVAAGLTPSTAAALTRVCRRSKIWIEPLLYHTIATHMYHPDWSKPTIPLANFQKHSHQTRHLLFGRHGSDSNTIREYLRYASGLRSLAIWHDGIDRTLVPVIRTASTVTVLGEGDAGGAHEDLRSDEDSVEGGLERFSGSLRALFGSAEAFTRYVHVHAHPPPHPASPPPPHLPYTSVHQLQEANKSSSSTLEYGPGSPTSPVSPHKPPSPSPPWLFQSLTHLEITHTCPSWEDWSGLGLLPKLTHIAIPWGSSIINLIVGVLKTCKTLKVLVLMSDEPLPELEREREFWDGDGDGVNVGSEGRGIRRGVLGAEVEVCLWDYDLFRKDGRVVKCYLDDPLVDWYRGCHGGTDFWAVAEELVKSAARAKVGCMRGGS